MTDSFATQSEYAAALRIALDVIDTSDLPGDLARRAVFDAAARLDCPTEDRLVRVVQLLSITLAGVVSSEHDVAPADALRRLLLGFEASAAAST